jgi:SOS-response transcriptional repressor LexA
MARHRRMTDRHFELLQFIRSELSAKGHAPTRAEIAKRFSWWPNAVQDALKSLQRTGAIRVVPGQHRGIELTAP